MFLFSLPYLPGEILVRKHPKKGCSLSLFCLPLPYSYPLVDFLFFSKKQHTQCVVRYAFCSSRR